MEERIEEDRYVPTLESIQGELAQIEAEATLYSVEGVVDAEMVEVRRKIDKELGILIFLNDFESLVSMARLMALQDTYVERYWALHEDHLSERSERLFAEDLTLRKGRPMYEPDVESLVRVTPLVDYTLGQDPYLTYLPAGSIVTFDVEGKPPQQVILLAAEGGWRSQIPSHAFPRKGLLVGPSGDYESSFAGDFMPSAKQQG